MERGALIVIEGIDRSGKTTQCKKLIERLKENNISAELMSFPDRSSSIGKVINEYLTKSIDLPDQVIHLLFSANRWEFEPVIKKLLLKGVTVILDRYSYSGVAYSAAKQKPGMSLDWCKHPEIGLPKPDCVLFLTLESNLLNERKGFGIERYENLQLLENVSNCYSKLMDDTWQIVDANKTIEDLSKELYEITSQVICKSKNEPLKSLW